MIALTEEGEITSIQGFRDCVHEEWTRGLLADIEGKDSFWRERLDQGHRGEELCSGSVEWL